CPGRLVLAYLPHIEPEALVLRAFGRTSPTGHDSVDIRVAALDAKSPPSPATDKTVPVAGLPHYAGEVYMVQRAKLRPATGIAAERAVYVAPAYGCEKGDWDSAFMERIRMCMYPQYMLDRLPLPGPEWSVVRFDQVQPISKNNQSLIWTEHCL